MQCSQSIPKVSEFSPGMEKQRWNKFGFLKMPPQSFHLRHPRSFQWRIPTICAWSLASVPTGLVIPASQTKEVLVCLPISSDFYQHAMGTQWLATLFLSPAMKRILSRKRSGRKESSMQTSKAPCNDVQQVLHGLLHQELLVHQCDWNSHFFKTTLSTWPGKVKVKTIIDSDLSHLTGTPSIQKPNGNVLLGSLLWSWQKDRQCCLTFGVSPAAVIGLSPASWFHLATAEQISWGKSICKVSTKVWSVGKCFKCTFAGNRGGQGLLLLNFLCKSFNSFCPCEMPCKFSKPSAWASAASVNRAQALLPLMMPCKNKSEILLFNLLLGDWSPLICRNWFLPFSCVGVGW